MQSEGASNQTSAGWSVEGEKVGAIGILWKIDEGGIEDVPLSDAGSRGDIGCVPFRISVLPLGSGTLAFRSRVVIFTGLV